MKKTDNPILLLIILLLFGLSACELLSENNDDCDATKMETMEEPVIYLNFNIPISSRIIGNHTLEKIIISGSISKIYCSGKQSGHYTYNTTFIVDSETLSHDEDTFSEVGSFIIPQLYKYKFENTQDRLVVLFRVKIYRDDGIIYETTEMAGEFFYNNLLFDANEMKHYVAVEPSSMEWVEVTS